METVQSKLINDFLKTQAKIPLTDDPIFKLVWSDDEYELRRGTFAIKDSKTNIILAYAEKVERVPKYNYIKERWILEQHYPPEISFSDELPDSKYGSYEPIFVFEDKHGRSLPLNKLVVEIILCRLNQPPRSEALIRSELQAEMDKKEAYIDQLDFDTLNDESYLVSMFHDGSAILNPWSKE